MRRIIIPFSSSSSTSRMLGSTSSRSRSYATRTTATDTITANTATTTTATTTDPPPKKLTRPRLPIPPLRSTLDKYLKSIQPFLLEDEARGGAVYQTAYATRVKWAEEFEHGLGRTLQDRLVALDKQSPHNWLDDNFWPNYAYLQGRSPLLINSNWWLALHNDSSVPRGVLEYGPEDVTGWQVRRASWMVNRLVGFKEGLLAQELYPDTTRTGLWLRDSTMNMFNVCRIPRLGCDIHSKPPLSSSSCPATPSSSPSSDADADANFRKIVVMVYDWFYSIDMYPPSSSSPNSATAGEDSNTQNTQNTQNTPPQRRKQIPPAQLERTLRGIVKDAKSRLARGERATPVGILSADERDLWAKNLEYILGLSPTNVEIHNTILNSILHLSLDAYTYSIPPSSSPSLPSPSPSPPSPSSPNTHIPIDTPPELKSHLHNIRSSHSTHPQNRWYDKALTLILESNSRAGAMGEHSPCDALVPSIVCEYACVAGIDSAAYAGNHYDLDGAIEGEPLEGEGEGGWERMEWVVDEYVRTECVRAQERAKEVIEDSDDSVLYFSDYGSQWISESAHLPPDPYIQLALQLAYYRTSGGQFTATYETALTRMFHRGRTETIRSYTMESREFVRGMVDRDGSAPHKYTLLTTALRAHSTLTRQAATGRGIDRHLLGLRLLQTPSESASNALFADEVFAKSQEWKLCTSGLSAGLHFRGTGYGNLAAPDMIKFGIESKYSAPETSTPLFQAEIVKALRELKEVCLAGGGNITKSNL